MSKFIVYGTAANRKALVDKLIKNSPKHTLIEGWDGSTEIPANSIVSTELMPPFAQPLDCSVIGAGMRVCTESQE